MLFVVVAAIDSEGKVGEHPGCAQPVASQQYIDAKLNQSLVHVFCRQLHGAGNLFQWYLHVRLVDVSLQACDDKVCRER